MELHVPKSPNQRIVIVGGGFGGLKLAQRISRLNYQVVLLDRNNFHQFQPLFYQVATSGLEPSSIIFPFRKIFQKKQQFHFRLADVEFVDAQEKVVHTSIGSLSYDYLVVATGAGNNFFGNKHIEKYALPMKSIQESLTLRNTILERFEEALNVGREEQGKYLTFVIAGAGPTGVELAGTLCEMRKYILPKDYPELNFQDMKIILVEGAPRVLNAMDERSSKKAHKYLIRMSAEIRTNTRVEDYDGTFIQLNDGSFIESKTLVWAAGIKGNSIAGIPDSVLTKGNRLVVDGLNKLKGVDDVYAIGDVALMTDDISYPNGHPQLAQVAIQQGNNLALNFKRLLQGKKPVPFKYKNLGTMATVGRNKAVVELPKQKFAGFFAWMVWMLVHLRSILGIKNKWIVFMNWVWNYFTYNLSLRLIIHNKGKGSKNPMEDFHKKAS
jgi:NADH dehydrogenase